MKKILVAVVLILVAYAGFRWGPAVFPGIERALGIDPTVPAVPKAQPTPELAEQTLDDLARLAHQLKGAAGGYGFPRITDAAGRLESCVKAGADLDQLRARAADLAGLCQRARAPAAES